MFERLRSLLAEASDGGKHVHHFDDNDYRVAAAALMVHAANIDGSISEAERVKLHELVRQRFELDDADADRLIEEATAIEREAVDLYRFTARLNRSLNEQGRARIVEMLWQIAYADGVVSEFEDNLIWRTADLLGVSRPERIALRDRVAAGRA
jgi:uncharacterized tellurite resistance protein B-like protein